MQRPIVNLQSVADDTCWDCQHNGPSVRQRLGTPAQAWRVRELLTQDEVRTLHDFAQSHCQTAVGLDGILSSDISCETVGSYRASAFAPGLAQRLWERLKKHPWPEEFGPNGHCDWDEHTRWRACGVNPLFRFIQYRPPQGRLIAHYDAPYVSSGQCRSLFSLLLYLSSHPTEGFTRFLHDAQDRVPFAQRDFSDWTRCAEPEEVLVACSAVRGDALVFEHRMLHDASTLTHGVKLVARSDILFERVP